MEAAVSSSLGAMCPLLKKLDLLLAPQYRLRYRVKKGIRLLKEDVQEVSSALMELTMLETPSLRAKCWMEEARELSYDVQDFVDDMIRTRTDTDARTIRARSHRIGLVKIAGLHQRLKRSTRIARFRNLLREARGRHQRYQLHMERKGRGEEEEEKQEGRLEEEQSDDCRHGLSAAAATVETVVTRSQAPGLYGDAAISLVVIDDSRIKLSKMLTIEGDQQLKVVSIVGSAGLGKTSLAKQVYHELGWKFDLRAFVRVSRKPDMRRVLGAILSQVHRHDQPPSGPVQNLIDDIKEHLCNKRYFILVDDLWEKEAWDIVYTAFPNDKNGSRIITTTQDVDVALGCSGYVPKNILMMKPLCIDDSRKLFFSRVFGSEQCPDEIKEVSNNIIRKCGGLLLAITNLAGLLASQVDNFELWYHVWDSLCSSCTVEEIQQEILNLSYSSLPHCLKTCLLYFTMYPEGSIIWKADLVKQWIAEGFMNAADGKHKEEVAQCYFDDLVNRGMIQPMQTDDYNSEVLSCTVHHIVLDFITHKSKDAKFISAIDYSQTITGLASLFHRQSLYSSSVKYGSQPARTTMSQLRSLAFFGPLNCIPSIVEFKFLRVLILEFWGNHDGHTSLNLSRIYRLFQLRYLKISGDIKVELPVQMRQLQYLETLEIDARILVVPLDIVSLPSLLHLCLQNATKLPDGIGRIRSLCTLQYFDLSGNSEENIRSLGKLTNLRHLHLTCSTALSDENLKRKLIHLVSSVAKLGNLISLTLDPGAIKTANSIFFYNSRSIFSPLVFLQRLELLPPICFFSTLPNWIGELHKLRILNIMVRELPVHDINILKELPALTALLLYVQTALEGTVVFTSMAFPALRYLKFKCSVMFLTFMEGAIPELRRLELCFNAHRGQNYGRMLDGIEHLLNLQEIAAQIGVPLGADESDKTVGKLSFEGAIRKHPRCPSINIQWVKQIEEEDHPQDLPCKHEIIEKGYMEDTEKDDGRRYMPANANTVMERPSDPFNPPGLAVPAASKAWQMAANNNPWRAPPPPLHNSRTGFGDASLFSTSLPVHPHEKLNSPDSAHGTPSMDDTSAKMKMIADDPEEKDYRFDFDLRQIHDLLPDEDECFSGITNEIEPVGQTNATEELEEFDVFGSGGMELNIYPVDSIAASFANSSIEDGARGNSINPFDVPNTVGTSVGEHPFGEHPSRTLFVRNINSNVEDSELRSLFEQYGEIRTLYTATKHRGFIMISYFDIRSARNAMRALQNKPLRRRKLDIHFSVPKENPSDKDLNQGTLVIFNLDPSVSNEEVRQIFGAYGEVKEIRETPNKKHHKFIEFYDVRAAEAALRSLDKSEIAGKRIKLEPSRPGGTRRNLMQQLGYDLDQEDPRSYRDPHVESPIANSLPGACAHYRSPTDHNMLQVFTRSPTGSGMNATRMPSLISNASKIAPIGKDRNWSKYVQIFSTGNQSLGAAFQHSHSYQDHNSERRSSSPGTLSGPQFVWCSPKPCSEHSQSIFESRSV